MKIKNFHCEKRYNILYRDNLKIKNLEERKSNIPSFFRVPIVAHFVKNSFDEIPKEDKK